jgi:hypothetical protein
MKTTPPIDLDQAPWLAGVEPIEAIRGLQSSDPGSSKMGWPFLWPANEPWPVCTHGPGVLASLKCDLPYLPVLQLRRDAFPDLPFPSDTDLFQLLWCPMLHFVGDDGFLLYWRRSRDVEISRSEPLPRTIHFSPIISCVLDPEKIPDYPNHLELGYLPDTTDEDGDELWGEEEWDAMNDLGPASGTKLFGFPRWEQHPDYPICPKCAKQMKLLLSMHRTSFAIIARTAVGYRSKSARH